MQQEKPGLIRFPCQPKEKSGTNGGRVAYSSFISEDRTCPSPCLVLAIRTDRIENVCLFFHESGEYKSSLKYKS